MQYSVYSLHQLRCVALCSIPFTACIKCSFLHYAVFPLEPALTAVCCIMLYSLYSLHQLQLVDLCFYSPTHFNVTVKWLIFLSVSKTSRQILLEWQCSVLLRCEGLRVCCDVSVELLPEINRNILKEKMFRNLLPYRDFKLKIYRVTLVVLLLVVVV